MTTAKIRYEIWESPIGVLLLEDLGKGLNKLRHIPQPSQNQEFRGIHSPSHFKPVIKWLKQYFKGCSDQIDFPLDLSEGTPFQQRVWNQLIKVPFGETVSYGELAARVKNPKGSRAVGGAVGRNPLLIVVPCHRVISGTGSLGGFSAGLSIKKQLLALEGHSQF